MQTGATGEAAVRCVGGEVVLRVQTTTLAIPPLPVAASVLIDKSTSKRLGTQTVLQCMSPLLADTVAKVESCRSTNFSRKYETGINRRFV